MSQEKCDACGEIKEYPDDNNQIGAVLEIDERAGLEQLKEIQAAFGKTHFWVCWICGIKAWGIKTLQEIKQEARYKAGIPRIFHVSGKEIIEIGDK